MLWKQIALGAAFVAVIAAPEALHAMIAPRAFAAATSTKQASAADSFVPTCSANAIVVDTRPDPVWVGTSYANDNCWAPKMPPILDGATAKQKQLLAGMAAQKRYDVEAVAYQKCISNFLAARKSHADKDKKLIDASFVTIETHRITTSVNNQKKVAALTANAINAFNEFGSTCDD